MLPLGWFQALLHPLSYKKIQVKQGIQMSKEQVNNPLHGKTLEKILNSLVEYYGWDELADRIDIRCFQNEPSVKSSLKFLRKTPWARKKVEHLYIAMQKNIEQ